MNVLKKIIISFILFLYFNNFSLATDEKSTYLFDAYKKRMVIVQMILQNILKMRDMTKPIFIVIQHQHLLNTIFSRVKFHYKTKNMI